MDQAAALEAAALDQQRPMLEAIAASKGNSEVQRFYRDSVIFLTGGSGFLGKQLIEKLFRSCQISKVYILLRSKRRADVQERMQQMLKDPVFDTVKKEQPNFSDKIQAIEGDLGEVRLGIKDDDWTTVTEEVDVIFHVAATTKFDESLRTATLINVRGTSEALILGKACKNLKSFVYVSTAYSHATKTAIGSTVKEEFQSVPVSPENMISLAEEMDADSLNNVTTNLIDNWPNTYTFTKAVAEELIRITSAGLPVCIVRPGIIINTYLEPSPGWLDKSCINGVVGVIFGLSMGVLHTYIGSHDGKVGFIPCDYVNNAIIVAAKTTAVSHSKGGNDTKIYTVSSTQKNPITTGRLYYEVFRRDGRKILSPKCVYYSFMILTQNAWWFKVTSLFLHLLPAYVADLVCVVMGKRKRFVKLAKKMYHMSNLLSYFSLNEWSLSDTNLDKLYSSLSEQDKKIFNFDVTKIDWALCLLLIVIGQRKYILKDGLKNTKYTAKKQNVFKIVNYVVVSLYIYFMWNIVYFVYFIIWLFTMFF